MASASPPPKPAKTRPVVLVVEDDPLLRFNTADIVERAGYAAIEVANADEAIRVLEQRIDIRLIFTDVNMPGSMDGLKLAAMVRDRWPPVEIIITSGVLNPKASDLPERARFFPKPFAADLVTAAMRDLIGKA
jgi:CheY-like chemotaxis protein